MDVVTYICTGYNSDLNYVRETWKLRVLKLNKVLVFRLVKFKIQMSFLLMLEITNCINISTSLGEFCITSCLIHCNKRKFINVIKNVYKKNECNESEVEGQT